MPLISQFYGILVYMYMEKGGVHQKPHIHARYRDQEIVMDFSGEILAGGFDRKQLKLLEAWVALREDELHASWTALTENGEVIKIEGLK